jgi:hypothetical protein
LARRVLDQGSEDIMAIPETPKPQKTATETSPPEPQVPAWAIEIEGLLTRAAELSVEHSVDPGAFMRGAWAAYVESRPELRAHLEELELRQQLAELRTQGVIGEA